MIVIDLQAQFGNKWAKIATYLLGKADNDVHMNLSSQLRHRRSNLLQMKNLGLSLILAHHHILITMPCSQMLYLMNPTSFTFEPNLLLLKYTPCETKPFNGSKLHLPFPQIPQVQTFPQIPQVQTGFHFHRYHKFRQASHCL
nr:transcription factor MYB29-like [Ipomoea trifida]